MIRTAETRYTNADEFSSKREPYFPGNYEWPGVAAGVVTRGRRALLDKRSFFHSSWRRYVSFSPRHPLSIPSSPTPILPLLSNPFFLYPRCSSRSSLSLFRCSARFSYAGEARVFSAKIGRVERNDERGPRRTGQGGGGDSGCGDLFLLARQLFGRWRFPRRSNREVDEETGSSRCCEKGYAYFPPPTPLSFHRESSPLGDGRLGN